MSAMDISDEGAKSVIVADIESNSGLSISVHPLVLLNVSDHYTRIKLQDPSLVEKGLLRGALLAKQSGREIDIINSYNKDKDEREKETGTESGVCFPKFLEVNESSLFLQLNPVSLASGAKEFPVSIYESIIDVHDARLMFIKVPYKVETNEAERVAVDHVAKPSVSGAEASLSGALVSHLTTQRNAIAMLYGKIRFLYQYLEDAKNGVVPMDHDIVRQISSLCQRLPLMDSKAFDDQFSTESDDVLLMAYLATITTGVNTMNDLIDKFNLVYGGSGSSGQMQGGSKKGRVRD
ncbi:COP9 signalosome complex subunit 6 [Apophysomyces sp. BC1015]|nr:COP9 signalosome complex subunit 6 [Apophysomyces sp. BC1015]